MDNNKINQINMNINYLIMGKIFFKKIHFLNSFIVISRDNTAPVYI